MNKSFRKIQMTITTLVIAATGALEGNTAYVEPCAPESCSSSCGQFLIEADFLYLRAFEGGLSSACDGTEITDIDENGKIISTLKGRSHEPDFEWNPGFRVGVGYEFENCLCGDCGVGAYWTHYKSRSHGNKHHKNKSSWRIDFDVVDFLYGCEVDISCFKVIPYGGIRYAKIDQKLHSHFLNTITTIDSTSSEIESRSRNHADERFTGVGGLVGIEGDFDIGCNFSLYGNISFGCLYGKFHVRSKRIDEFDTGTNFDHLRKRLHACQAVVDSGLGVRWRTCLCDSTLWVQLGFESHHYFNLNQFCGYGDLSLDGLTLGAGLEF